MKMGINHLLLAIMLAFLTSEAPGQTISSQRLRPKGVGGITTEFLRNGVAREVIPPSVPLEEKAAIDVSVAGRLAVARAKEMWGGNPTVGSIVPLHNAIGEIVAYDVDVDLGGQVWKPYETVASDWQRILREQDQKVSIEARTKDAANGVGPDKLNSQYASLTISANYDAYPIRAARRGVSNFFTSAWVAKSIAAQVLGTPTPKLLTVIFLGPWERGYRFESAGKSIVVHGQEPWQWYDNSEYYDASMKESVTRKDDIFKMIRSHGLVPEQVIDSLRLENQSAIERILNAPVSPQRSHLIPGYNSIFQPLEWHYGCSPTAGAMVLNYWDNRSSYGLLNGYFFAGYDKVQKDYDCHIALTQRELASHMGTDGDGETNPLDIYPGMKNFANSMGYSFSGGPDWHGSILDWYWNRIVEEIDDGYPFVFSASAYPNDGSHSVAAVGYDDVYKDVLVYTTWRAYGTDISSVHYSFGWSDFSSGEAPHPGGPSGKNVKLTSLKGLETFALCGTSDTVFGRGSATITWDNYGSPGHHVNLWYSIDGGVSWQYIDSPPDNGTYIWSNIPNIDRAARIAIEQYSSASTLSASDGSYGDFRIVRTTVFIGTNPSGCTFYVDGKPYSSLHGFFWDTGTDHTIAATSPQSGGTGVRYTWSSWSDGGAMSHRVTKPSYYVTYTANFSTQDYLTMNAGSGGTVSPASAWYNSGESVLISASPNSGHLFNWWTGSGTGSYTGSGTPASVTMNGPISEDADFAYGAWVQTNGPIGSINCFAQSGTNLFAGRSDGEVLLSTNNGAGWIAKSFVPHMYIYALAASGTNLLAGAYGGGVYCSTDSGTSWTAASTGFTNPYVTALVSKGTYVFAGTYGGGVFYSSNSGGSWTQLYNQLGLTNKYVTAVAPHVGIRCFAGTSDGIFYFNPLMGDWTAQNEGLTDLHVSSLALSGTNLFAGTLGGGVFILPTAISPWTWYPASKGLSSDSVYSFAVSGTNLFAGPSRGGVFLSTNCGTSWIPENTGLTYLDVLSLAVSGTNLIAGIHGRGIWMRQMSDMITSVTTSSATLPVVFSVEQNYPNPFNPTTNIEFSIVNRQFTSMKVYDVLGREVTTLVNEAKEPGTYTVQFDGSNLTSGVYFYRLQAGDFVATKRLILLK
jgi:hypothetical protein